jgi:hypothetical protein
MKERAIQVLAVAVAVVLISGCNRARLDSPQRKAWKDESLARLVERTANVQWLTDELSRFNSENFNADDPEKWLSDQLILMRNGDWLAYASICQKENARIADMFLARGSDGRWYYSTYHFCKSMLELRMNDQPSDLRSFITDYSLREFDGKSDECLQPTWSVTR